VANNYTTSTDAFNDIPESGYSSSDFPSSDYPNMDSFVTAASRLIDLEVGRWEGFFYPTTDDKTYYYDGSGLQEQEIDEFASITSVSVAESGGVESSDYTAWSSSDYFAFPANYANLAKPITKLIVDRLNGTKLSWYGYRKAVKIVGVPGYSTTIPDVVALACRIQAVRWFMRAKGGYQDVTGTAENGQLFYKGQVKLDGDVKALLSNLVLELAR
jgi:hypothetical protein